MATLFPRPNGRFWINFDRHGKRHTIRLGKISESNAMIALGHIEQMVACDFHESAFDPQTSKWFQSRPLWLKKRIAATGLAEVTPQAATLGQLIDYFAKQHEHLAANTIAMQSRTARSLKEYFSENRSIASITKGDAAEFRVWMETKDGKTGPNKGKGLSPATASRRAKHAKRLFQLACDKMWIEENPFNGMKGWVHSNPDRNFFVERSVADQILEALPTSELKLLFALGRYGGLRLPQEAKDLKWEFVNWEKSRFSVYSQKNQRHVRKRWRVVPIFPELRPYFDAAWDDAIEGEGFVIPYLQKKTGQGFTRIVDRIQNRLSIVPWPKTLQNLRVSRANEVETEFGAKLEEAWIGHSPEVASENYLMVLESEYDRAARPEKRSRKRSRKRSTNRPISQKRSKKRSNR